MVVQWRLVVMAVVMIPLVVSVATAVGWVERPEADFQCEGMKITVQTTGQTLSIDPLPVLHHEFDGVLTFGEPGWRGDFLLPRTAWVFRALTPGSLSITLGARRTVKLVEGRDYLLDPDWGASTPLPAGAIRPARNCTSATAIPRLGWISSSARRRGG